MNDIQRQNLARLALYVQSLPSDYAGFQMSYFVANGGVDSVSQKVRKAENLGCGTCACFAGHGPICGIDPIKNETWGKYLERCFGTEYTVYGAGGNYDWLFHEGWPNSTAEAAKRAAWLLEGLDLPDSPRDASEDEGAQDGDYEMYLPDKFDEFQPDWSRVKRIAETPPAL